MTSAQQDSPAATATPGLAALRGNCMGAAVLLIIEFGIGIGVNLYVTLPNHTSFLPTVFGSAVLAVHAIVAIVLTSAGLAAILIAAIAGSSFVSSQSNGASLAMALATAAAMFCYLAAVFSLR